MYTRPRQFLITAIAILFLALAAVVVLFRGGLSGLLHESERLETARVRLLDIAAEGAAGLREQFRKTQLREELSREVRVQAEAWAKSAGELDEIRRREIIEMHGPLLRKLALTSTERGAVISYLMEAEAVRREAGVFAESHGLSMDDAENRRAIEESATAAVEAGLSEFLGPERYAEYRVYEKTVGWRRRLRPLADRLEGVGEPLREMQTEALLDLFGSVEPAPDDGKEDLSGIPDDILERAAAVLSARQHQVLKLLQAEQRWSHAISAVEQKEASSVETGHASGPG